MTSTHPIEEKLLSDYLKIMVGVISEYEFETGMTVEEEEQLREKFVALLGIASGEEMLSLVRRFVMLAQTMLAHNPERGYLTARLLEDILDHRPSKKFAIANPGMSPKNANEIVEYSQGQEDELKKIFLKLKPDVPETHYDKISSLIYLVTGQYIDYMEPVYKKYAAKTKK